MVDLDVAITKMSSKGQIVIPVTMRKEFHEGEKLLVIQKDGNLILKKIKDLEGNLKDDLEFAKRTELAWKRYDSGKFISKSKEDFLDELKKW